MLELDGRRPGVLVADEDAVVRDVLEIGLQTCGFAVWLAADGPEVLEGYHRHRDRIDVVLLEARLGPQVLATLRLFDPAVRYCLMSGGYPWPGEAHLPKPFSLTDVVRLLQEVAAGAVPWP